MCAPADPPPQRTSTNRLRTHRSQHTGFAKTAALSSSAAAGVFALQHQAEAAVVYSGVQNISVTALGFSNDVDIGLNLNGVPGYELRMRAFFSSSSNTLGRVRLEAFGPVNHIAAVGSNLNKLAAGNTISAGLAGWGGPLNGLVRQVSYSGAAGNWTLSNQTGFGAFRMNTGSGSYRYGWIRLKWTDHPSDLDSYPNSITAIDWAYESTINAPILAGDTGAVPEPSRALLALAGAGAAFLRRGRRGKN